MTARTTARHAGTCPACGDPIQPGHPLLLTTTGWVHDDCDQAAPTERPAVVCQTCWLAKPCDCEDPT